MAENAPRDELDPIFDANLAEIVCLLARTLLDGLQDIPHFVGDLRVLKRA